jgi:hypothetical protein
VDPIPVELSRTHVGKVDVPHVLGTLPQWYPGGLCPVFWMPEETEIYVCCVFRKKSEVHPLAIPGGSQRIGLTGPNSHLLLLFTSMRY